MEIRLVPRPDGDWRYIIREKRVGTLAVVDVQGSKKADPATLKDAIDKVQAGPLFLEPA